LCDSHIPLMNLDANSKATLREKVKATQIREFIPNRPDGFVGELAKKAYLEVISGRVWDSPEGSYGVCEFCLCALGVPYPDPLLADTACCALCGSTFDAFDFGLLFSYSLLGKSVDEVHSFLPRKRMNPDQERLTMKESDYNIIATLSILEDFLSEIVVIDDRLKQWLAQAASLVNVVILRGPSGSGKSFALDRIASNYSSPKRLQCSANIMETIGFTCEEFALAEFASIEDVDAVFFSINSRAIESIAINELKRLIAVRTNQRALTFLMSGSDFRWDSLLPSDSETLYVQLPMKLNGDIILCANEQEVKIPRKAW
jgi:hypothetical protein